VDFVLMDPGDDLPPEDEDGHKWWLCAEHYDQVDCAATNEVHLWR
jgi:hypothetical protein